MSLTGEGIAEAVAFLTTRMKGWGFEVQVHPTDSQPIVYGEIGPKDAPFTWLTYGHYDVYPADAKAEGWKTDPWQPVVDGDRIWGRGAGDNKGQHLALLNAIALYRELHGELPIRIKVVLEGDEETGSRPLPGFVEKHRDMLRADLCCYSDGPMFPNDQPVLLMGVRGILGLEFAATGAKRNLHSGNFGGVAPNPTLDLIHLLAGDGGPRRAPPRARRGLRGRDGDPGRAGGGEVAAAGPRGRHGEHGGGPDGGGCGRVPRAPDAAPGVQRLRLRLRLHGQAGTRRSSSRRRSPRPTSGSWADRIPRRCSRPCAGSPPTGATRASRSASSRARPPRAPRSTDPFVPVVKEAVAKGFGREPLVVPSLGGTTPDYVFTKLLGLPSIVVPLAPYDENNHAPNESTKVSLYLAGIRSGMRLIEALGRRPQ